MARTGPKTELEKERLALNRNQIDAIHARVRLEKARAQVKLLTMQIKALREAEELRGQAIEILEKAEARGEQITAEDLEPNDGSAEHAQDYANDLKAG